MSDQLPTRLHVDPSMDRWRVAPRHGRARPIIATGHQPMLWHPGILAKDFAVDVWAERLGCSAVHVSVDHNPVEAIGFEVPVQAGDSLSSRRLMFDVARQADRLPPNRLPAVATSTVERVIDAVKADSSQVVQGGLDAVRQAYAEAEGHATLADQTACVLGRLKFPYLKGPQAVWSTSELVTQAFVDRLLADPVRCVRAYNRAAAAYPEARVRSLYVGRDVVELPLWAQGQGACTPVYADLGDTGGAVLFTVGQNQQLALHGSDVCRQLRPRAVSLSAIMRSELCDLFVHGTGGGVYDQVTERWWTDWVGQSLAPKGVVSADAYLPFEVPVTTAKDHTQAQWYMHHLWHNVGRHTQALDERGVAIRQEKETLLDQLAADRDKHRRAKAFKRIHAINAELRDQHALAIAAAKQQAERARAGLLNRAVAGRRDWCFALYPVEQLQALRRLIAASV